MLNWLLDNPHRLRNVLLAVAIGAFCLMLMAVTLRVSGGGEPQAAPGPTVATPTPVNTRLVPPSPVGSTGPAPDVDFGDPAPILLEALQAWLSGDQGRFGSLASPEVVEAAHAAPAPAPGQKILGGPEITEPGPTQATYRINTTDGWMRIVMAVSQSKVPAGWVIADMEYIR